MMSVDSALIPVLDGHNDVLLRVAYRQEGEDYSFFLENQDGHLDLPRAKAAGFAGGFFAIYIPPVSDDSHAPLDRYYALDQAMLISSCLFQLERQSGGELKVVQDVGELEGQVKSGRIGAIMHMEGAEPIDEDLHALEVFYRAGLRSIGIVWSRPNAFGYGVPFVFPSTPDIGPGLTDAGKRLVKACNELGILVDVSHLNEAGFWDVVKISEAPIVATHSNVHAICPVSRNLTDRQLDAIKDSDGMVGLNFAVAFLRPDGKRIADTPIDIMIRHIDYMVERVGIDRVGLGSDFDGALISSHISDVTGLPKLLNALREHGYSQEELEKMAFRNWLRVLKLTWKS